MSRPVVLVVGDSWQDQSLHQPHPTADGAAGVARHLATLGFAPMVATPLGNDDAGRQIVEQLQADGIPYAAPVVANGNTARCIGAGIQQYAPLSADEELRQAIVGAMQSSPVAAIVIVDLGNGAITQTVLSAFSTLQIPYFVYCRSGWAPYYVGARLLMVEPRAAVAALNDGGVVHPGLAMDDQAAAVAVSELYKYCQPTFVVTRDSGCHLEYKSGDTDGVVGRGIDLDDSADLHGVDFAIFAAMVARDLNPQNSQLDAIAYGLAAAKRYSRYNGFVAATRDDLDEELYQDALPFSKLMDLPGVAAFADRRHRRGDRVVLAIYPFDNLSAVDIEKLRCGIYSRGDTLIAAYWTDAMLGILDVGRPHVPDSYRATHLALLEITDAVCRAEDPSVLVRAVKPDTLLVPSHDVGQPWTELVAARGGTVTDPPIAFRIPTG